MAEEEENEEKSTEDVESTTASVPTGVSHPHDDLLSEVASTSMFSMGLASTTEQIADMMSQESWFDFGDLKAVNDTTRDLIGDLSDETPLALEVARDSVLAIDHSKERSYIDEITEGFTAGQLDVAPSYPDFTEHEPIHCGVPEKPPHHDPPSEPTLSEAESVELLEEMYERGLLILCSNCDNFEFKNRRHRFSETEDGELICPHCQETGQGFY